MTTYLKKASILFLSACLIFLPFVFPLFVVQGDSMEFTYHNQDVVLVDTLTHLVLPPRRGEVLALHNPHKPTETIIKRVVALPGERVEVLEDALRITKQDGSQETFTELLGAGSTKKNILEASMNLGPLDYYVLGDNRPSSLDSRLFGAVQLQDIIGRPISFRVLSFFGGDYSF